MPIFATILFISAAMGAYLPPIPPYPTMPCLGTPAGNYMCTEQFLSCLYGLQPFLSESAELLTMVAA
jgi:hypothetical protein